MVRQLREDVRLACHWLTDMAQVKTDTVPADENVTGLRHTYWKGAVRGEYSAAKRQWWFFCPLWHTGQAVKSLSMAHRHLGDKRWLDAALLGGDFILANRVADPEDEDFGLLLGYEDQPDKVNTSAQMEATEGLFVLSDVSNDAKYREAAVCCLEWVGRKAYVAGEGVFLDEYDPAKRVFSDRPYATKNGAPGRPLLEDGVFLKAHQHTRKEASRRAFYGTAERLLRDEDPPGNWVGYAPCDAKTGSIHPRHAYWWGGPMLMAYEDSGDERFLECAKRAGEWYLHAMRRDGGIIRSTYLDFNTKSFGHATSGSACGAILLTELWQATGETRFREGAQLGLDFCRRMQLKETEDPNLKGVILEKVLAPDGTDRSPYHVRDLGTIFFIQAAVKAMEVGLF